MGIFYEFIFLSVYRDISLGYCSVHTIGNNNTAKVIKTTMQISVVINTDLSNTGSRLM